MFRNLRSMSSVEAEPNLIPVMNLFVAMIPFLLLAVAFFQVGVVPATLPTHTENTSDVDAETTSVTVSIIITDDDFQLSAMNQSLTEGQLNALKRTIPQNSGQYDYAALQEALRGIKQQFPQSDTVIMLPNSKVPYGELVRVMDHARYTHPAEGSSERRQPLLPNVVLSRTL